MDYPFLTRCYKFRINQIDNLLDLKQDLALILYYFLMQLETVSPGSRNVHYKFAVAILKTIDWGALCFYIWSKMCVTKISYIREARLLWQKPIKSVDHGQVILHWHLCHNPRNWIRVISCLTSHSVYLFSFFLISLLRDQFYYNFFKELNFGLIFSWYNYFPLFHWFLLLLYFFPPIFCGLTLAFSSF